MLLGNISLEGHISINLYINCACVHARTRACMRVWNSKIYMQ